MSEDEDEIDYEKASEDYILFAHDFSPRVREAMLAPREPTPPPPPTETEQLREEVRMMRAEIGTEVTAVASKLSSLLELLPAAASKTSRKIKKHVGAPRKPSKAKATSIYRSERKKGRSCKVATATANEVARTEYEVETLKKYARQNGGMK